jgi:formylglycine-generating enzyme required for sulfatase activity
MGGAFTAAFPKGYNAFFIMKYEISQGQYADFLNGSGSGQASVRYPFGVFNTYRFQIDNTGSYPQNYVAYRPDRACNFLSYIDVSGYLDWAALRPMTELQFEKAARGGGSTAPGECAWGNTTSTIASFLSGAESGAENITTLNANLVAGNIIWGGGDAGQGPVRCGIFATVSTTTRQQTGASYWGVMELSGNVREICIHGNAGIGIGSSTGGVSWGNGYINASCEHDVANWPNTTSHTFYIIWRGGDWNTISTCSLAAAPSCSVSNRFYSGATTYARVNTCGGRGIR